MKLCGVSFVAEAHLHINAGYLFAHEGEVFAAHARRELGVDTRFAVHRLECRQDGAHQRRIINLGRIAALVVKLDFTAKYRADALSDFIEASFNFVAYLRAVGTDRCRQIDPLRNHCGRERIPRLYKAAAHHGGVSGVDVSCDDRLKRQNQLSCGRHRVDRFLRASAVAASAFNGHVCDIDGSRHGAFAYGNRTERTGRSAVNGKHFSARIALKEPVLNHLVRTCPAFFPRLEDEHNGTGKVSGLREQCGCGKQPCGVTVVAAQMGAFVNRALPGN